MGTSTPSVLSRKARERLDRIKARCDVLRQRVADNLNPNYGDWRQELSALNWAIEWIETTASAPSSERGPTEIGREIAAKLIASQEEPGEDLRRAAVAAQIVQVLPLKPQPETVTTTTKHPNAFPHTETRDLMQHSDGLDDKVSEDVIGAFQAQWNEALEAAALVVDQCNREGPYNAIGAASRIRDLKNHAPHGHSSASDARDAARWTACLRAGAFPVRLGSLIYKDGGYVTWTINGEHYGASENECADSLVRTDEMGGNE